MDMEIELFMLATIVEAILFKHHKVSVDFPIQDILKIIPNRAGEFFNGKIGINMFFRLKEPSVFELRYYSKELEVERTITDAELAIAINKIDLDEYEFKYTLNDFRNGQTLPALRKIIKYTKSMQVNN